ncbi:SDR family oxidoreductase [Enterococcus sp. CWB-B31]|uniref:SDR family oxidoreductase n=1 Tax=Enterococcus sp. CWB-B31 TaxID=2885159 RepID=UPI001E60892B|nr:SDR family oxidoreductase [Enterococcus sp. CWB-B31]MCB5953841.1 SDR family oxidoreductase [Enterococcus sp. CWB-B31]
MKDWLNIAGKKVIVTGGSSGIGASIVDALLEEGVSVANFDLKESSKKHENLMFLATDISSKQQVEENVRKVEELFGAVDGLVNNAGINVPRLLVDVEKPHGEFELSDTVFDKIFEINQKGLFLMTQTVARIMVKNKHGSIINMSSESGLEGSEGQSAYAATKAAVNSYTRSWAKELGRMGIRVIGIAPGIMEETGLRTIEYETALAYTRGITVDELRKNYSKTTTIPLGRSGRLDEVADLVCYYLSDRASYITGITTNIAGGKTRG